MKRQSIFLKNTSNIFSSYFVFYCVVVIFIFQSFLVSPVFCSCLDEVLQSLIDTPSPSLLSPKTKLSNPISQIEELRTSTLVESGVVKALERVKRYSNKKEAEISAKLVKNLWRNTDFFKSSNFYEEIGTDVSNIENFFIGWFVKPGNNAQITAQTFETMKAQLPAKYLPLCLDPGIATRANDFLVFSKEFISKHPNSDLMDLRNAFSNHLGKKIFYRGMGLTPEEVSMMKTEGISSRNLSFFNYIPKEYNYHPMADLPMNRLDKELDDTAFLLARGPLQDMLFRITSGGEDRFSISLTDYKEVAIYVTNKFKIQNKATYVFKLEIPVIDTIPATFVTDRLGHGPVVVSPTNVFYMDQEGVESFAFGKISPENIVDVEIVSP